MPALYQLQPSRHQAWARRGKCLITPSVRSDNLAFNLPDVAKNHPQHMHSRSEEEHFWLQVQEAAAARCQIRRS